MSTAKEMITGLLQTARSGHRAGTTSLAELALPPAERPNYSVALGIRKPKEAAPTDAPTEQDADKLLAEVADRLDPGDLAAIKADPAVKRRFLKQLVNQRELNAERAASQQANETPETKAEAKRLASLGLEVAQAEADKP